MKILFVGFGSIAKKHLAALDKIGSDVECWALRSRPNADEIEGVQSIYEIGDIPSDIDFAIISTPTANHTESISKLRHLGCPLFIEKPAFHQLEEEELHLCESIKEKELTTYVACNLRFHPTLVEFKRILEEVLVENAVVQEVNIYCGSYLPDWRPGTDYKENYSAHRSMGGGVDLDLIHEIDYAVWFFGWPKMAKAFKQSKSHIDIDSPDSAYYLLQYENFVTRIALNYFRPIPKRTFEIVLDTGVIHLDLIKNNISIDGEIGYQGSKDALSLSYQHQLEHFISTIQSNGRFENDIFNAVKTLEICLIDEVE